MKITHIETIKVSVPIKPMLAIRHSGGMHAASPFLLVRVHTDAGIIGLGEASCTPFWSGEDHATAKHYIDDTLAPVLIGKDPRDIEPLSRTMDRLLAGNVFTKSALQMAFWDILGKEAGLPLYRLWGGLVRETVPLKFSISGASPTEAARIAGWAVEQGFKTVKVKVGGSADRDYERVLAVRLAIGTDVRLGVDANGGWSVREAISALRRMKELDLAFAEQPVPPDDPAWMTDVRRAVSLPIIADESAFSPAQAMALVRESAADVFSIYVGKVCGLAGARQMAAIAQAAGLVCTVGSNLELGVGSAAMIHLALSTPGIDAEAFPCDIIGPFYYEEDILTEPLPLHDGQAARLEKPGLGVDLDMEKVARFTVA